MAILMPPEFLMPARPVEVAVRGEYDEDADDWTTTTGHLPPLPLFHWAPAERRKQIIRRGLRPSSRPTTNLEWRAPYVCFADSPSWAWGLSGAMNWAPAGEWDLWQTSLDVLPVPVTVVPNPDRWSGAHEVRTPDRVPKSLLWLAGHRTKLPPATRTTKDT